MNQLRLEHLEEFGEFTTGASLSTAGLLKERNRKQRGDEMVSCTLNEVVDGQQSAASHLNQFKTCLEAIIAAVNALEDAVPIDLCNDDPEDIAGTATEGSSIYASRCDHVHKLGNDIVGAQHLADAIFSVSNPQNVGASASKGTSGYLSRSDHVHRGVSSLSAGTGITLTGNFGNITVSAQSGSGGLVEGNYSSYSLLHTIIPSSSDFRYIIFSSCFTASETKALIVCYYGDVLIIDITDGSHTELTPDISYNIGLQYGSHSAFGKYWVGLDRGGSIETAYIYKDGTLLQQIDGDASDDIYGALISPSGRYLILQLYDYDYVGDSQYKYLVYRGS